MKTPKKPALNSLAGRLLLAMPGMPDPRFDTAVIALCMHDSQGALGIGIGDPLENVSLHALLDSLGIAPGVTPDCPVLAGGPVEPGRGFVLHSLDWRGEATIAVGPHWSLTGSQDILQAIADGTGPRQWLVALGYAGWGAGQLDREMREHGWYSTQGRSTILFDTDAAGRWAASWRAEGVDPVHLAPVTGHA